MIDLATRDSLRARIAELSTSDQTRLINSLNAVEDGIPQLVGTYAPRSYQKQDIAFLRDIKKGAVWHEPGLGKTLIASDAAVLPATVSVPTYLVDQWVSWLKFQYPGHKIVNAYSDDRGIPMDHYSRCEALKEPADWHVMIHEMMRAEVHEVTHGNGQITTEIVEDRHGDPVYHYPIPPALTFVIDEAHRIRGRAARQSRGAFDLTRAVPFVYQLTGSPIFRVVDDLFAQLRIMDEITFRSYDWFVSQFCVGAQGYGGRPTGARNIKALTRMTSKWARLRTYDELAEQGVILPEVIPPNGRIVRVPMTKETRKRYEMVQEDKRNPDETSSWDGSNEPYMYAVQVLHKLRQETANAKEKLDALSEVIDDVRFAPDGSKRGICIFTWFRNTAERVGKQTGAKVIHGEMLPGERRRVAQSNDLIVANLAALSEGVDLSHCRVVIFFEEDYSPGYEFQALRRVLRASSDHRPILLVYIHLADSVDEVVHYASVHRINDARTIMTMVEQHTRDDSSAFGG